MRGAINVALAFGAVVGMLLLWWVGMRLFLWVSLTLASLAPHIGKKHRHRRWDELNKPKARD